ncbi:hypothetical protein Lepto7375DRAFT_0559 [Leptolyngbya sp. PCC 7375]|nr:hypothetical protein Lepto7375DRAFT_0559 [Leptolyngbya sp. PCC 7375]
MTNQLNKYGPTLFSIMSQHCWGWNLFDFVDAKRPFLVTDDNGVLAYPCVLTDNVSDVLVQIEHDYDGPAQYRLLCFEGVPTEEQFVALWQNRIKGVMVSWVDIPTSLKWQRQTTAIIDEHYPGGVRQILIEHFGEGVVR